MNKGAMGEQTALEHLLENGYELIARNYRSRYGEIDLIVADKHTIVFVEVKTRAPGAIVSGWEAITAAKQRRLFKTALMYLAEHDEPRQPRFDAVSVVVDANGGVAVEHMENIIEEVEL